MVRVVLGAAMSLACLSTEAAAQYRYVPAYRPVYRMAPQYYAPRVYQPPRPAFSRDAYVAGGTIIGGAAGTYYGGPYGGVVGAGAGGYYGGRAYDVQGATRYYYPQAYGIQTTSPYMLRTPPY